MRALHTIQRMRAVHAAYGTGEQPARIGVADVRNIDAVFIAGQVRKWAGAVLDVDLVALREDVRASRERVLHAAGRADRPRRCTDQQREPSWAAHPVAARPPN
jgi:hypothetical protein